MRSLCLGRRGQCGHKGSGSLHRQRWRVVRGLYETQREASYRDTRDPNVILTVLVLFDGEVADARSKLLPANTNRQNLPLQGG